MEKLKDIVKKQQASVPGHFQDPEKDRMLATLLELAEEICVLRDRLDTCLRLARSGQTPSDERISRFEPGSELIEQRLAAHTKFYETIFGKL
jgi:hypothetical protein